LELQSSCPTVSVWVLKLFKIQINLTCKNFHLQFMPSVWLLLYLKIPLHWFITATCKHAQMELIVSSSSRPVVRTIISDSYLAKTCYTVMLQLNDSCEHEVNYWLKYEIKIRSYNFHVRILQYGFSNFWLKILMLLKCNRFHLQFICITVGITISYLNIVLHWCKYRWYYNIIFKHSFALLLSAWLHIFVSKTTYYIVLSCFTRTFRPYNQQVHMYCA
jgi:hypothetical protein